MTRVRHAAVAGLLLLAATTPARADATAFIGANTTPANRQVRGFAFGFGLLVIGFEGEYSYSPDDPSATAPSLRTGMGNVLLQTPGAFFGFQPYFTTKETGTGLGLFVCKLIVERNDGQIELTDTSPNGTTFSVLLPAG